MIMRPSARCLGWLGVATATGLLLALPSSAAGTATLEYQVKATFLYNFTKFIEWPMDPLVSSDTPFEIGVVGNNPFGPYLAESMDGQRVHDRPVRLVEFRGPEDVRPCAVLFVPDAMSDRLADITARLKGVPVLVVGESPGFADRGGSANFFLVDNKVRFEINPSVAGELGLRISSKLLAIARIVGGERMERKHDANQ
jgi:hypothetical protein